MVVKKQINLVNRKEEKNRKFWSVEKHPITDATPKNGTMQEHSGDMIDTKKLPPQTIDQFFEVETANCTTRMQNK